MMSIRVTQYTCRFVPNTTQVYTMCKPLYMNKKKPASLGMQGTPSWTTVSFYTIPFDNRLTRETTNAVLAFACPDLARVHIPKQPHTRVVSFTLADLGHHAATLKLPLVVILNSFCDIPSLNEDHTSPHYEIHFHNTTYQSQEVFVQPHKKPK